jgi:histidine triad (HIT) family protein
MTLRPTAPGECLVIPRVHVDHFTDVPEDLAAHMMRIAHRLGRRMRATFPVDRVGMLVHGYGVAHAHLIIVLQQGPHHITSDRMASVRDGRVVFTHELLPVVNRTTLDEHAQRLRLP